MGRRAGILGFVQNTFKRSFRIPRMPISIPTMSALSPITISSTSLSPVNFSTYIPLEDIPPISLYTPMEVLESQVDKLTATVFKVIPPFNP